MSKCTLGAVFLVNCILVLIHTVNAQNFHSLSEAEDSLQRLQNEIRLEKNDDQKKLMGSRFLSSMLIASELPGSVSYPFDSLIWIGRLTSPDKAFRLLSWNIPFSDGSQRYYGIIQVKKNSDRNRFVYNLTDRSDSLDNPQQQVLDCNNWYGALYYKIIPFDTENKNKAYILLGWHGENTQITQKIIDVLTIDSKGNFNFGAPVFSGYSKGQIDTRIIFSFSASSSMVLRYEEQGQTSSPKWDAKIRQFEKESKKTRMIVFDHLAPLDNHLEGHYQFHVPSSDQVDGFKFENGKWVFVTDIEARNKH